MNRELKFHEFSEREEKLAKQTISLIATKSQDNSQKLEVELSKNQQQSKLKIAFVGQHNSGKSTIVSALTNNKSIKISNNVETDLPTDYEWNGVLLTDTPGLWAGKTEVHDKVSLQAIKESDLLVFCITSSLFDDLLLKHFIELAYTQSYQSKLFLVINKMSQESGEFKDLVNNYRLTLRSTMGEAGAKLDDFPVCFIDAHDYIEGVETNDEELINECSNFKSFVSSLNSYIKQKSIVSRLDTPCRLMIGAIDSEISSTGTELDKNLIAILRQCEAKIRLYSSSTKMKIADLKEGLRSKIMNEASNFINKIGQEEIGETQQKEVNDRIKSLTDAQVCKIQDVIEDVQQELIQDLDEIMKSEMADFVFSQLEASSVSVSADTMNSFNKFKTNVDRFSKAFKGGADAVSKLIGESGKLSGSHLHNIVLNIGHFFGHAFKPYGAIHIVSKIANFAKWAGPVLSVIPIILDIVEEKQKQEIQEAKLQAFNQFASIASDIVDEIDDKYMELERDLFQSKIEEIQSIRDGVINSNKDNNSYVTDLKSLRKDITVLITDIAKES